MKPNNSKRSPLFDKFKPVAELFPRKFPSHKLTKENTLDGLMPTDQGVIEQNTFFNKIGHLVKSGWKLRGIASAPYARGEMQTAIVFEKLTPAVSESNSMLETLTEGIYWHHASPQTLFYEPEALANLAAVRNQS